MQKEKIHFRDLGQMEYREAWEVQEKLMQENLALKSSFYNSSVIDNKSKPVKTNHHLLFTEHPLVYTLGKSGNKDHVLINQQELEEKQIAFYQTNRGGDITFHGPGQIVGYPILDLEKFDTDIGKYLRNLEEVIILTLADFNIKAGRSAGETGVWLDPDIPGKERKICAMGVRCSRWVTMHGFALNVNTDLSYFNFIIPCGIANKQVSSMQNELGGPVNLHEVKQRLKLNFEKVFEADLVSEFPG